MLTIGLEHMLSWGGSLRGAEVGAWSQLSVWTWMLASFIRTFMEYLLGVNAGHQPCFPSGRWISTGDSGLGAMPSTVESWRVFFSCFQSLVELHYCLLRKRLGIGKGSHLAILRGPLGCTVAWEAIWQVLWAGRPDLPARLWENS